MQPTAVYEPGGIIVKASTTFFAVSDVKQDDIEQKKANIFNLLSEDNEGIIEVARGVFNNTAKY
jgi:hypothetical protein